MMWIKYITIYYYYEWQLLRLILLKALESAFILKYINYINLLIIVYLDEKANT